MLNVMALFEERECRIFINLLFIFIVRLDSAKWNLLYFPLFFQILKLTLRRSCPDPEMNPNRYPLSINRCQCLQNSFFSNGSAGISLTACTGNTKGEVSLYH
jgi:hypothetical protein